MFDSIESVYGDVTPEQLPPFKGKSVLVEAKNIGKLVDINLPPMETIIMGLCQIIEELGEKRKRSNPPPPPPPPPKRLIREDVGYTVTKDEDNT
jgi:hypothetical protein